MEDKPISRRKQKSLWQKARYLFKEPNVEGMVDPIKPKRPHSCDLLISERCNLRCKKCHFWKSDVTDFVSIPECKKIVDSLSEIGERPFEINLGGGEPLLIKGIIDLIHYCKKKGLNAALSTNATLIDNVMAKKLARSGISRLSISLDSLDEKTHDMIVGVDGAYGKVMKAFEYLEKHWKHGYLNVHTVLSELNMDSIIDLVKWVNQNKLLRGINIQAVSQPFRTELIDDWHMTKEYEFLWPKDLNKVNTVLDELIELKKQGYKIINPLHQFKVYRLYYEHPERFARKFRCNIGDHTVNINALGVVHLCCFMKPLGGIRYSTVEELWLSPQAETTRYAMYNCRKSCNNILNCFFEEEDNEAGFTGEVSVKVDDTEKKKQEPASAVSQKDVVEIPKINFCFLNVTPECDVPCRMCYIWKTGRERNRTIYRQDGLSLGEWRWIINDLSKVKQDEMHLFFGGGEPLLRKGMLDVVRFAQDKGFFTMLGTSCYPINVKMAHEIAESGLRFLNVSLDSHNPKIHNYLRGNKNVYKRVMRTATWLRKLNPHIDIGASCLISKVNLHDIIPLVDAIEKDERFSSMYFQALVQPYDTSPCNYWYRLKEYSFLWPDNKEELVAVLDTLIERKKKGNTKIGNTPEQLAVYKYYYTNPEDLMRRKQCLRETDSISINWLGYVSYCDYLGPIGSVRDFPIERLLRSTIATIRRREMKSCEVKCNFIEKVYVE